MLYTCKEQSDNEMRKGIYNEIKRNKIFRDSLAQEVHSEYSKSYKTWGKDINKCVNKGESGSEYLTF